MSNFTDARLMDFVQNFEITPSVNQIECHPHFQQIQAQRFCQKLGVQMEVWSSLKQARDNILQDKTLREIGSKYNKTPAKVILRWIVQRDIVTIPASKNIAHMRENFNIFNFSLDRADLLKKAMLDTPCIECLITPIQTR